MTIITTTELRENLENIFQDVINGKEFAVRKGRGKKAKIIKLIPFQGDAVTKALPKNHSLILFANSTEYQNLPTNQFSKVNDLKKYHKENFLKGSFEDKYSL